MIGQGIDPDWLLDLDLSSFLELAETHMRLQHHRELEQAYLVALGFGSPKELVKLLKASRRKQGQAVMDGDDLVSQVGGGL